jgi:hypothetical protein
MTQSIGLCYHKRKRIVVMNSYMLIPNADTKTVHRVTLSCIEFLGRDSSFFINCIFFRNVLIIFVNQNLSKLSIIK